MPSDVLQYRFARYSPSCFLIICFCPFNSGPTINELGAFWSVQVKDGKYGGRGRRAGTPKSNSKIGFAEYEIHWLKLNILASF